MSNHNSGPAETLKELEKNGEVCIDCQDASLPAHHHGNDMNASGHAGPSRPPPSAASARTADVSPLRPMEEDELRPAVMIEYCDRCRWAPRASWTQTELLLTFPTPILKSIRLVPLSSPETGGRFRVWCDPGGADLKLEGEGGSWHLLWDRKTEGGFPELKILKQRLRDLIQPDQKLGHSDAHPAHAHAAVPNPITSPP